MLVRRLAIAAAISFVPLAAGCGSSGGVGGGGKPSTAELSAKIRASDPDVSDEEATCVADALRDNLPASVLRELMEADVDDPDSFDDAAFDDAAFAENPEAAARLMGAMFTCAGLGEFDMDDFDMDGTDDSGQNPFGG